jgi:hypothetical protein
MCSHSSAPRGRMQASVMAWPRVGSTARCLEKMLFASLKRTLGQQGTLLSPTFSESPAGLYSPLPAPVAELVDAQG